MYYMLYLSSLCHRRHWPEPHYESFPSPSSPQPKLLAAPLKNTPTTITTTTPTPAKTKTGLSPSPSQPTGTGTDETSTSYACIVRVNNREYKTDKTYDSETLARENAAMRAYLICRNFSVNDGMYPSGHDHGGVVQGVPVAIGTGRKRVCSGDGDDGIGVGVGVDGGGNSTRRGRDRGRDRDDDTSTASSSDFSVSLGSRSRSGGSSPDGSWGSSRSGYLPGYGNGHGNGYGNGHGYEGRRDGGIGSEY